MNNNQVALQVLKEHVGEEMFNELTESLAGATIYFTNRKDLKERNRCIRQDFESGISYDELAEIYKLSKSRIYTIVEETFL